MPCFTIDPLWYGEGEVVALGTVILRLAMLVVTEIAVEACAIVGRGMWIFRLQPCRLCRQFFGIMAYGALVHLYCCRLVGFPVALRTGDAIQTVNMAARQLPLQFLRPCPVVTL